jgi:hypothetical protein
VPQNGDDLLFEPTEEEPSPRRDMHNDLVELRVRKVEFCTHGWSLDGNELTLLERVGRTRNFTNGCGAASSFTFDCNLKLGSSTIIDMYYGTVLLKGNIDLNGNNLSLITADTIRVSGQITGMGNVTAASDSFTGNPKIVFEGSAGNTFNGTLTVSKSATVVGEIIFDKEAGSVVNDALLIRHGAACKLARSGQIGDNAQVSVTGGSQFLLNGHTEIVGALCLTNLSADTTPTLVDATDSLLWVQGDIIAVNDSLLVIPIIKGKLGLPGPAGFSASSKMTPSSSTRKGASNGFGSGTVTTRSKPQPITK